MLTILDVYFLAKRANDNILNGVTLADISATKIFDQGLAPEFDPSIIENVIIESQKEIERVSEWSFSSGASKTNSAILKNSVL